MRNLIGNSARLYHEHFSQNWETDSNLMYNYFIYRVWQNLGLHENNGEEGTIFEGLHLNAQGPMCLFFLNQNKYTVNKIAADKRKAPPAESAFNYCL